MAKLTALKVKHAKAGRHGDGLGLYLLVSPNGAKSWVLRVKVKNGTRRDVGLGSANDYTLDEARERSRELRKAAREGRDPVKVRDAALSKAITFKEAVVACHGAKAPGWSDKNGAAFLSSLEQHAYPKIGALAVDRISERDVAAVLAGVWLAKPALGKKLRHRIGLVLDFARASGWRAEAAPREGLRALLAKQTEGGSFKSMPYEELPGYVAKLQGETETVGRLALLFTILTACRNGEARSAMWSHIDFDKALWNRPAGLMLKTGKAHSVTLSPEALEVLERAKAWRTSETDCLIFPGKGGRRMSDMSLAKVFRPTGYHVHGLRGTFRTWAAERMPSIPEAVAEAALAHLIPDKVERAYNKANFVAMRRTLLDAWGRYANGRGADVVQLPLRLGA